MTPVYMGHIYGCTFLRFLRPYIWPVYMGDRYIYGAYLPAQKVCPYIRAVFMAHIYR